MERNNPNYHRQREGKENHSQYKISNWGSNINKADPNYRFRNNRWNPYGVEKYRAKPMNRNTSTQYKQQQNLNQSYNPQPFNQNHKPQSYRNNYNLQNTQQSWPSSQTTTTCTNHYTLQNTPQPSPLLQTPPTYTDGYTQQNAPQPRPLLQNTSQPKPLFQIPPTHIKGDTQQNTSQPKPLFQTPPTHTKGYTQQNTSQPKPLFQISPTHTKGDTQQNISQPKPLFQTPPTHTKGDTQQNTSQPKPLFQTPHTHTNGYTQQNTSQPKPLFQTPSTHTNGYTQQNTSQPRPLFQTPPTHTNGYTQQPRPLIQTTTTNTNIYPLQSYSLSQSTSTNTKQIVESTVNPININTPSTSSHDTARYSVAGNINVNKESLTSVGRQYAQIPDDRVVTSNGNIRENYRNPKRYGQSLSQQRAKHELIAVKDDSVKNNVNNTQDDPKDKIGDKEKKSERNDTKWKLYKAKHGNGLKPKPGTSLKSITAKTKEETLKHVYMKQSYSEHNKNEMLEIENIHNGNQWKLYKMEHGIEPNLKSNTTHMNTSESKEKIKISIPLSNKDYLEPSSTSLIDKLYSGKQCSTCGERMDNIGKVHMDGHFRKNSFAKSRKYPIYRPWYQEEECDNGGENIFEVQLREHQKKKPKNVRRPRHHSGNDACLVCKEKFTEFFNDQYGEWQLKDAVDIDKKTYHEICADDRDYI